ncbi:MAG TPA: RES family NAD+ phosphorylase [Candidatus Acidoferrales bacterium]|nr:RES family NAD+ phosphorylase [Candidatus Acidoferrales bacterium]
MISFYRVLRKAYARAPFDGEGAYRYGGRWSSPGTRLSYASEHQSLAMLEYFVHLDQDDPPSDLVLAVADVPEELIAERVTVSDLPATWRGYPAPAQLSAWGDEFVRKGLHCVLLVPSVLAPGEDNCLINPAHAGFRKILIRDVQPLAYDPRMFRKPLRPKRKRRRPGRL